MITDIYTTSDLPLTAYLIINGLELLNAKKAINGKFEFILKDPNQIAVKLSMEYVNSEFCKFDGAIRSIKKILYSK